VPQRRARILVTQRPFPETIELLRTAGTVVHPGKRATFTLRERLRHAARADAMLAFMPDHVDDRFLALCPRLRIIAAALKGYDNLDVRACRRRGVWLTIVRDELTVPTAELVIGSMIALARHVRAGDAHVRSPAFRGWRPQLYGRGLAGSRIGLVGFGAIGRAVAERLRAFGAALLYSDRRGAGTATERRLGLKRLTLPALLRRADVVVLGVPLTGATLHLIDERALRRMKPGAFLVNPARGSIVDERAVLRALESGRLGGYAADVFAFEDLARADRPLGIPRPLLAHPRTLFTPHLGSAVVDVRRQIELRAARNIVAALRGRRPPDAVVDVNRRAARRTKAKKPAKR
jgi:phosphonate dehydrogenase